MPSPISLDPRLTRRGLLQFGGAAAAMGLVSACSADAASGPTESLGATSPGPRRGGNLAIGVAGGGPSDSLDAHTPLGEPDISRVIQLYDTLVEYGTDGTLGMMLAESVEPNEDATTWVIRLKDGLTFHDGKPIEAEDVIFTLQRITDPSAPKSLASAMATLKRDDLKALDTLSVQVQFSIPDVVFPETLADYKAGIVPRGYDPARPIGSGAFKADTFTPGERSSFARFEGYWEEGVPHVERLDIINFADDASRVNALQSGQVHAITSVPFSQAPTFEQSPDFVLLETETDNWRPFGMHCGVEPYTDARVRQALRLIVDRQQMVDQALSGHGRIGNDLWSPNDPASPQLEQRVQDLDQARFLLKQAGHEGLQVQLDTSPAFQGLVEFATIFAQQAQGVVDVRVNNIPAANYYGDNYLKYPFSMDYKGNRGFLRTAQQSGLLDSPYNLTHFDDEEYLSAVTTALTTVDDGKRSELIAEAQHILHDRGGYIIPLFTNLVNAHSATIAGIQGGKTAALGLALGEFRLKYAYFTA